MRRQADPLIYYGTISFHFEYVHFDFPIIRSNLTSSKSISTECKHTLRKSSETEDKLLSVLSLRARENAERVAGKSKILNLKFVTFKRRKTLCLHVLGSRNLLEVLEASTMLEYHVRGEYHIRDDQCYAGEAKETFKVPKMKPLGRP